MLRLYDKQQPDYMPGLTSAEKKLRLAKMSYQDFLLNVAKVDHAGAVVLPAFRRGRISASAPMPRPLCSHGKWASRDSQA